MKTFIDGAFYRYFLRAFKGILNNLIPMLIEGLGF